jgi:hypothetical protein
MFNELAVIGSKSKNSKKATGFSSVLRIRLGDQGSMGYDRSVFHQVGAGTVFMLVNEL